VFRNHRRKKTGYPGYQCSEITDRKLTGCPAIIVPKSPVSKPLTGNRCSKITERKTAARHIIVPKSPEVNRLPGDHCSEITGSKPAARLSLFRNRIR
jgi:hypothetical protein